MPQFSIGKRSVGDQHPVYFIADIAANHDGDLNRAIDLIHLAKEAGADAAKFQNFTAEKIVSDRGFKSMGGQQSHQSKWKKSVFEVYQGASVPWDWTKTLKEACDKVGIDYFSTPYDFGAIDMLDPFVSIYKVGSGDITWPETLRKIAGKNKPVFIAAGASTQDDVERAVDTILPINKKLALMQCNTNYTGNPDNFKHIHLNVLKAWQIQFPDLVLGLSDHTHGPTTVLGAVALGARVIEKHFTDDNKREGPDHHFAMNPITWHEMVERTREMEQALGSARKFICPNEMDTIVIQRRCLRAAKEIKAGTIVTREMVEVLRPAPRNGIFPYDMDKVVGKTIRSTIEAGDHFRFSMFEA
jgi:N-acetylneuraminate synthase